MPSRPPRRGTTTPTTHSTSTDRCAFLSAVWGVRVISVETKPEDWSAADQSHDFISTGSVGFISAAMA